MASNYNPKKQWTNKPPILYAVIKLQELQARLQKAVIEKQLNNAKMMLEHEIKKVKNGH